MKNLVKISTDIGSPGIDAIFDKFLHHRTEVNYDLARLYLVDLQGNQKSANRIRGHEMREAYGFAINGLYCGHYPAI